MARDETMQLRRSVADFLSLERNVVAASGSVFLVGLGEELWKKFLPKYLEALGATTPIIGLFGTAQDLLDACYQYPGGWIADRVGRRSAFLIFLALATAGYLVYLLSPSWPWLFLGVALLMAWQSIGGLLWTVAPHVPFIVAGIVGIVGTIVFAATVEELYAS